MSIDSVLTFAGNDGAGSEALHAPPRVPYNPDEQRLSVFVQREIEQLVVGYTNQLVLLKLYPQREGGPIPTVLAGGPDGRPGAVRPEIAARIAADVLGFFEPLHGGVVTQEVQGDLIVQHRRFSTAYPHINLQRYDFYDLDGSEPLLAAWCAVRIQNMRRETRTNRMIDLSLLVLEIGQALLPRFLG
jgi:hypothetical protein